DTAGRAILGDTWRFTQPILVPILLGRLLLGLRISAQVGLRACEVPRRSFRTLLISSPLVTAGGLAGAILHGASGAAYAMAAGELVAVVLMWRHLRAVVAAPENAQ
ncbi:MAG TPA: hypothetical protein VFA94_07530, partial [Acidimicrobiales bacterium]|nr:hypothetical protein [Acidimicrobiales bacterium]